MAHFYRVTVRHTKEEAMELAKSLSKDLKNFGYPGEMRIRQVEEKENNGKYYTFYVIESVATPAQLKTVMKWMNAEPLQPIRKLEKDLEPGFRKHLKKAQAPGRKEQKSEMAWRKDYIKKGGKLPQDTVKKSHAFQTNKKAPERR